MVKANEGLLQHRRVHRANEKHHLPRQKLLLVNLVNVSDAVILLPKLQTGIDVNVRFSGVKDFEYTSECGIFDLFNIDLYHGWLVDPQQEEDVKVVNGLSYNQLVEKIISNKNSADNNLVSQSLVAQNFLEESASQLTYHGLCELASTMNENELAIFFRNNHFSTIYKHKNVSR